jgi:hypothetical protein
MELLETFIRLAPEDIYQDELTHLDRHNLKSTHETLEHAVSRRYREKVSYDHAEHIKTTLTTVSDDGIRHARKQVDDAVLALRDEPYILEDLASAREQFKKLVRKLLKLYERVIPSSAVIEELKDEFSTSGRFYETSFLPESRVLILTVSLMDIHVSCRFRPGECGPVTASIETGWSANTNMHESWRGSLAIGIGILNIMAIPYVTDSVYTGTFAEAPELRWCFLHEKLQSTNT